MKNMMLKHFRNISGSILPIAVLLLLTLITLSAAGINIGYSSTLRSVLERAASASATAGAQKYFRTGADAGLAINEMLRVMKVNISNDPNIGTFYASTGTGSTVSYTQTFGESDNLKGIFRGQTIQIDVSTDKDNGEVKVKATVIPKPYFAGIQLSNVPIIIEKDAKLAPSSIALALDLSSSMKTKSIKTFIGKANVSPVGQPENAVAYDDVVLFQSQDQIYNDGDTITANGLSVQITDITDVFINNPDDLSSSDTFDNGASIFASDPTRGYIANVNAPSGSVRKTLSGFRVSELSAKSISSQDKAITQSYSNNRSTDSTIAVDYFNSVASYIEPYNTVNSALKDFLNAVSLSSSSAMVAVATFNDNSHSSTFTYDTDDTTLKAASSAKQESNTLPYNGLSGGSLAHGGIIDYILGLQSAYAISASNDFDGIIDGLTTKATGLSFNRLQINSLPNGGRDQVAGLRSAKAALDDSNVTGGRTIVLLTSGAPSDGDFNRLGDEIKSLTDDGYKIYTILLSSDLTQETIDQFKEAVEETGKAEPLISVNNPNNLSNALQGIASDLVLRILR